MKNQEQWNGDEAKRFADQFVRQLSTDDENRFEMVYNMSHNNRGKAAIFNQKTFTIPDIPDRTDGTDKDCNALYDSLIKLGFSVDIHTDLTVDGIMLVIQELAEMDHSDHDCLLIVVMSHGQQRGQLWASDHMYKLRMLMDAFTDSKCPTLAGKPKLYFIQACQGEKVDIGVSIIESDFISTDEDILLHPDFLLVLSTIPGYVSWRHPVDGAWFIEVFCDELNKNGTKLDLLELLTFTNQRLCFQYPVHTYDHHKQVLCISSMLRRILHFTEK